MRVLLQQLYTTADNLDISLDIMNASGLYHTISATSGASGTSSIKFSNNVTPTHGIDTDMCIRIPDVTFPVRRLPVKIIQFLISVVRH